MKRVISMAWKDLRLLWRDRLGAFFIIGFPILMGIFFGLVMGSNNSGGSSAKMKVAVVDLDQSTISEKFVASLAGQESVVVEAAELEAAKESVRRGQRVAVLVIPAGFGESAGLLWETPPKLQLGADPSRQAEVGMLQGYVMEAIGQLTAARFQDLSSMQDFIGRSRRELADDTEISTANRLLVSSFLSSMEQLVVNIDALQTEADTDPQAAGQSLPDGGIQFAEIEQLDISRQVDPNSIRGQLQKSKSSWDISFPQAMLWGVLGCVAGFSVSIARERTQGTLTRLRVAPISQLQILLGKALACFMTVVAVIAVLTGLGMALGLQPDSLGLLALAAFCVAFCFVGIMMVMALLGRTEQSVSGAGWALNMVMAMLGGCMIPVMFMPQFMQTMSVISPVRWAILALEGAIWREFTLAEMAPSLLVLVAVGSICLVAGTIMLQRMAARD